MLESAIASFMYEKVLSFNVPDSQSLTAVIDQYMEFSQQQPGCKYKVPNQRRIGQQLLEEALKLDS